MINVPPTNESQLPYICYERFRTQQKVESAMADADGHRFWINTDFVSVAHESSLARPSVLPLFVAVFLLLIPAISIGILA